MSEETQTTTEHLEDMLSAIKESNQETFNVSFKAAMDEKINHAIENRKRDVAAELFGEDVNLTEAASYTLRPGKSGQMGVKVSRKGGKTIIDIGEGDEILDTTKSVEEVMKLGVKAGVWTKQGSNYILADADSEEWDDFDSMI